MEPRTNETKMIFFLIASSAVTTAVIYNTINSYFVRTHFSIILRISVGRFLCDVPVISDQKTRSVLEFH